MLRGLSTTLSCPAKRDYRAWRGTGQGRFEKNLDFFVERNNAAIPRNIKNAAIIINGPNKTIFEGSKIENDGGVERMHRRATKNNEALPMLFIAEADFIGSKASS